MSNRIHVKGTFRHEEAKASEAGIYPGMLVALDSSGEVGKHSTEGGSLGDETLIAEEDALQGRTVAIVYADDSIVSLIIPAKGSVVNMLVEEDQVISIGEKIISAGNGLVKSKDDAASPSTVEHVLGISEEDLDLASGAGDVLCAVRVV